MKRILVIIILMLVLSVFLVVLVAPFLEMGDYAITGYDGPVATLDDISSPNIPEVAITDGIWSRTIGTSTGNIYPIAPDIYDLFNPCGLRIEVQSVPNVISQEVIDTVSKSVIDEEAETNTTTTVKIYKAKCTMSATVTTYAGGLAVIEDVDFWVALNDNADSIFSSADDRFAYFVEVYTTDIATKTDGITTQPTAGGYSFELTSLESEQVPQWLIDSGYTSSGSKFTSVKFPLTVLSAVPITYVDLEGQHRVESYATFHLGFDVILTGKWTQVSDYKDWDWPELPDFWGTLFDTIAQFFWYIAGVLVSIVVIARVKDPRYIALLLGLFWLLVFWQTGALTQIGGWLGI